MISTKKTRIKKLKVLFFGRKACKKSIKIAKKLEDYNFDVTYFKSEKRKERLPNYVLSWKGDYIICFRSLSVLPKSLLKKALIAAVNFHPGPPEYPGSGCINFALYDEVNEYGVTAHIMNSKVDNGDILEVKRFKINMNTNLKEALSKTHDELFKLCDNFIRSLSLKGKKLIIEKKKLFKNEKWRGAAKKIKDLDNLQSVDTMISKKEIKRIIRATYTEKHPPKIELHGYKFYLKLDNK